MVLSDKTIREQIAAGRLVIDPLFPDCLQPASVDLHLDDRFRVFRVWRSPTQSGKGFLDVREPVPEGATELIQMAEDEPFIIQVGEFVLASTLETVAIPDDIVARVDGKSSLGRMGLLIHATAGYVDPGFRGKLTLELSNVGTVPIGVYYKMKICQISFIRMTTPVERPYGSAALGSKYQDQTEPTASRAYQEFRKDG